MRISEAPKDLTGVATVNAAGVAEVVFRPPRYPWLVSQVSVEMPTAPAGSICEVRKGASLISPMIPAGDAAAGDPPITLQQGDQLIVRWEGATPGDQGLVYMVYQELEYG